ncbi:MAG TPA: AMP-binding protein [bacterium]|jgi:1-acyl-sn-glycerol-3-phosphate acyltransferase
MTEPTPRNATTERTQELLELVRALALELHPHRAGNLRVAPDSSLDGELGFDSLSRVELLLRIEQAFGVTLPDHVMATAETPLDLQQALDRTWPAQRPAVPHLRDTAALEAVDATPERAATLMEVLDWHVEAHADRPHVTLLDAEGGPQVMTYGGLLHGARHLAAGLLERDLRPGQPVAIMLPTCLGYFHSFMGVLLAGGIPVPIYPPARPSQIEDHLRRHAGILDNARTAILITVPEAKIAARLLRMQVLSLQHIVTPEELQGQHDGLPRKSGRSGDIAHLQYTSGSTGNPKGVVLTHDNLLANIRAMGRMLQADSTDVFVSWLPLYHDMGLIGAWLGSLYFSVPLCLMSPLTFLAHPERWLWAIHEHRGTLSGAPNFAYELCVKRLRDQQLEGLDLSSWRVAFNGAEPVIPNTLRSFQQRFASYGLRAGAMKPVYGLAECSVGLAFPPLGREPLVDRIQRETLDREGRAEPAPLDDPAALEFVACGMPLPGHEVRIVNEAGQELSEREEGRLHFKGPSATSGYYRNAEASKAMLDGEWLDSGDMAYIAGGDIFLTGRRKDIVIRAGRNIYPHELEEAIGELEGVRKGCVAVFGSTDMRLGTERLVALAETRERDAARLDELRKQIDALAVDLLGTPLDDIVLAPPHTVPKTSSGKIRRAASRELYEHGATRGGARAVWLQVLRLWLAGLTPQARRMRRVAAGLAYGIYAWAVLAVLVLPVWLTVVALPRTGWSVAVTRAAGRLLLALTGIRLSVQGAERLPQGRPCVLAVNHCSYLDGLMILVGLPGLWSFVAKRELTGSLFARAFLRSIATQFVERVDMQRGVEDARRVAASLREGRSLVFFPEGTFRRQPGLLPFHLGAFQAAVEAGAPVVPVVLRGTRSLLRDGQWLPRRTRVTLDVGAPIAPEDTGWNAAVALRDRVRADMLRRSGEPDLVDQPVRL